MSPRGWLAAHVGNEAERCNIRRLSISAALDRLEGGPRGDTSWAVTCPDAPDRRLQPDDRRCANAARATPRTGSAPGRCLAIKDPAAKLDALEKIRADFPQGNLGPVDAQMLSTLVNNFPDRVDGITTVFERIIGQDSD